ncbi:MAG: hypothetical protein RL719_129, partial [Actinomycetota bacterium]
EREIRYEVSVHNIHVDAVARADGFEFALEVNEICRQNAGMDANGHVSKIPI